MLANVITSAGGERILYWIDWAALIVEVVAVVIIVLAIFTSLGRYFARSIFSSEKRNHYQNLKENLGRGLLLGLEMLVAADIIRTVALEATLESVLVLGLLVFIRTFLSWALVVEIEGHWPWNSSSRAETENS